MATTTLERLQQLLPQLFEPVNVTGDLYLRFQLAPELPVLLSMDRVLEALLVPVSEISQLPNVPDLTIGIMTARDRVCCVIDLAQLLGLPPLPTNLQNYQIVTIDLGDRSTEDLDDPGMSAGKALGLAVLQVSGVKRLEVREFQSAGMEIPESLKNYQLGYFILGDERLLVLDAEAIIAAPNLFENPFI